MKENLWGSHVCHKEILRKKLYKYLLRTTHRVPGGLACAAKNKAQSIKVCRVQKVKERT